MVGIILAAGDGKRLKNSKNEACCKPLIKINEKSLITYALDNLVKLEINEAYIVVGKESDLIKADIGNKYENIKLYYIEQQEQKGLVDAFVQALKAIDGNETVVLQLADEIFIDLQSEAIKTAVQAENIDFYCGITLEENPEKIKNNFSVEINGNSLLVKCIEKPKEVTNNIKGTGFSIFSGKAQRIIKAVYEAKTYNLYDLCDCFNYLVALNYNGLAITVAKKEFNINTVADLIEAESFLNN